MTSYEDKKKNDRERIAAKRKEKSNKNNDVAKCRNESQPVANVAHIDINKDIDIKNNSPSNDEQDFEEFWSLCKKKVKKKAAKSAFNRLNKTNRSKAMNDIQERYSETEWKYCPAPVVYINGELWNDDKPKGEFDEMYYPGCD